MDSSLVELIQKATINGAITEENKSFIIEKAKEFGTSEIEVNIFIEASIKENKPNSDFKLNLNSIDISNTKWSDKLSYLFGIGILISGFFPWIEGHSSSSVGGAINISGGGGLGYSIPFGFGALYFAYNNKLSHLRKFYGLFISIISIILIASYQTHYSSNSGGISASAGSNAGPGVALMLLSAVFYSLINFINLNKIVSFLNSKSSNNSFSKDSLITIAEPILVATVLGIWLFFSDINYSEKTTYTLLLFALTLVSFVFKDKIKINKLYLFLLVNTFIDVLFTCFNIYSKLGVDLNIANDLQMQFGKSYSGNGELEFFYTRDFGSVLDESIVSYEKVIQYFIKLAKFISVVLIINKLIQVLQKFIEIDLLTKTNQILEKYHKKLIIIFLILLGLNISSHLYITLKNKGDYQNEINKRENQVQTITEKETPTEEVEKVEKPKNETSKYSESEEKSLIAKYTGYEESDLVYYNFMDDNGEYYNFSDIPNEYKLVDENNIVNKEYVNKKFKIVWKSLTPLTNGEYDYPYNKIISIQIIE